MRGPNLVALAALAITLGASSAARAVGLAGATPPPSVREEYVLLVDDPAQKLEHVLYAVRVDTTATSFSIGLPAGSKPDLAVLGSLDLARAVHALTAPYALATSGVSPVPPPPWETRGVELGLRAIDVSAADPTSLPFDASWTRSLAADRAWLAVLDATAPANRLEATTPAVRISFATDRPRLVWREPARGAHEIGAAGSGALEVSRVETAPPKIAPDSDAVAKILRVNITDALLCLDGPERPAAPVQIDLEGSIDRHGATTRLDATTPGSLAACVAAATRKKSFPRQDAPWTFRATLRLTPPAIPSRRTHIVVLGPERLELDERAHLTLVRELEPRPIDVATAFDPSTRAALGLAGERRLWLTEYVDRSTSHGEGSDLAWVRRGPPPPDGEPGTIGFASKAAHDREPSATDLAKPLRRRRGSRARKIVGFLALAALALGIGALVARQSAR